MVPLVQKAMPLRFRHRHCGQRQALPTNETGNDFFSFQNFVFLDFLEKDGLLLLLPFLLEADFRPLRLPLPVVVAFWERMSAAMASVPCIRTRASPISKDERCFCRCCCCSRALDFFRSARALSRLCSASCIFASCFLITALNFLLVHTAASFSE